MTSREQSEVVDVGLSSRLTGGFKYWAFLSYSHADEASATWIHQSLERFKVPKAFVGTRAEGSTVDRPASLHPVFRDRDELPASASLGAPLEAALRQSRNLIVICSPSSARSSWVDKEIRFFKALGRDARVFCVIVGGEPNAVHPNDAGRPAGVLCAGPALSRRCCPTWPSS